MDIHDFATAHGLKIEVKLRPKGFRSSERGRFSARIPNAEVKDGGFLVGAHGNGATEDEAVAAYSAAISERRLVIDAYRPTRRTIDVPPLASPAAKEVS